MTILFLNLPSEVPIVRRYMCSSFPGPFLFPPHELLALAGIGQKCKHEVYFIDAVAEKINTDTIIKVRIPEIAPDLIISILSFELFDKDVEIVRQIKNIFPTIFYGLFGHYPTHFFKETLNHTNADFILLGEPDNVFEELLDSWKETKIPEDIKGTVVRLENNEIVNNGSVSRIPNPNLLPLPPYDLLKNEHYKEPFMPSPFGLIQTARGCPFQCNYCVHSFGTKLTMLTPENVINQILELKRLYGIKSLRFIDDTFTAIPSRVIEICKLMIANNIDIQWTCLSRPDTIDEQALYWMKKAGCVRLNIGIESGSQKILDILNKKVIVEEALVNIKKAKQFNFEIVGFFLTGIPEETEEDVKKSIQFARETCDYVIMDTLNVYPGTPLFEKFKGLIDFSLIPYTNKFSNYDFVKLANKRRSYFYKKFYLSPYFFKNFFFNFLKYSSHFKFMVPYVIKRIKQNSALPKVD